MFGGIVLCGGKSSRMGRPKAWLPFGEEVLLVRVCQILSQVVDTLVVVRASGQEIPDLSSIVEAEVKVVTDGVANCGPLQGISTGLNQLVNEVDLAYVTSCDVPFLRQTFVSELFQRCVDFDCAIPFDDEYHHPLSAVYSTRVIDPIADLLSKNRRRPIFLLESTNALEVPVEELRRVDPKLDSLKNINTHEQYEAALKELND